MSYPAVSYTFANGAVIDATAINQNFADLVTGMSDGASDLNMNDATLAGGLVVGGGMSINGNLQDSSGYIGVMTSNPTVGLHIDGSCYISGDLISYPTSGGWYDCTGLYTIRGFAGYTAYSIRHRRIGTTNYVGFDLAGPVSGTAVTIGLPVACASLGFDWMGPAQVVTESVGVQDTPGRWLIPEGARDATIFKDYASGAWATDETSRQVYGMLRWEQ